MPDGDDTPLSMLLPRLSGSTPEKRMLKRTETPLTLARSHTAAWNVDVWNVPEAGRPANVPHSGHEQAKKVLMHRYYLFAAGFAPHISAHEVMNETRTNRYAIVVPISHDGDHIIMVRLDGACFASKIDMGETIRDAAKRLKPFLSCEEELDHQLSIRRSSSSDAIVAFPAPTTPLSALRTRADVDQARKDGAKTARSKRSRTRQHSKSPPRR